jgi:fructose-bisphosphate aldolase class 1
MSTVDLGRTARAIVADGKGILAADETPKTLTKRFEAHRIESTPDVLSFSYGRALQDEALTAWAGRQQNAPAGQRAFYNRARCDASAALGLYSPEMENASAVV